MMKMNSRGYTKDVVVTDAKTPCLMVMSAEKEVVAMLHVIDGEVWVSDFDTFMDAGFEHEHTIVPMFRNEAANGALREAWLILEDVHEYGDPGTVAESLERRKAFAAMWKYKTGKELVFKTEVI